MNRTPRDTHRVRDDAPGRRHPRAVCGAYVDRATIARDGHMPTCPACQQWIAAYDALDVADAEA